MQTSKIKKSLVIAMGASFAATVSAAPMTNIDSNPFGMQSLSNGYMQVADKNMGEGNCGGNKKAAEASCGGKAKTPAEGNCGGKQKKATEGNCGGNKNTTTSKGNNMPEGKCGEGKCGAGMMKMDNSSDAGTGK
jgi:uncharacterized low-complexity protein